MPNSIGAVIVIDGPDGTGKTTLAEVLQKEYGAHIIHSTWSEELEKNMDQYLLGNIVEALTVAKNQSRLVVIDRLWLSELVYSSVYRKGTQYQGLHATLDSILRMSNAMHVVALPYNRTEYTREMDKLAAEREEMYSGGFGKVWDSYQCFLFDNNYLAKNGFDVQLNERHDYLRYDRFVHDTAGIAKTIVKKLGRRNLVEEK